MDKELGFIKKLNAILDLAIEKDYKIDKQEVEEFFREEDLTSEQMLLVYDYLLSKKVAITGYIKINLQQETIEFSKEELDYLNIYLKDLEAMKPTDADEKEQLFQSICRGDALAKARMTELYLKQVVDYAKKMYQPQIFLGDLIQEGNVSLVVALENITKEQTPNLQSFHAYIIDEIQQGMQMLLEEASDLKTRDERMVDRVVKLDESVTKLTEEMGREITIEELSLYMEISEEEILDILKLAGEDTDSDTEA